MSLLGTSRMKKRQKNHIRLVSFFFFLEKKARGDKILANWKVVFGSLATCIYFVIFAVKVDDRGMRWFYTGDIGRIHRDGCLEIIDRKKDIVKLQHGEYVSLGKVSIAYWFVECTVLNNFPLWLIYYVQVEAALIVSSFVDNIMLHADPFHSYCVALVVVSQSTLEEWASNQGISYSDLSELCTKEETVKEVHASLVKVCLHIRVL